MIYHGIGLNEETVVKYFNAAKSAQIGKPWIGLFRDYLAYCLYNDFQPMQYTINDPFVRAMVIQNAVLFQIDFVENPVIGKLKRIMPLPRGMTKEILRYPVTIWPDSAYSHIVGLLPSFNGPVAKDTREAIRRAVGI